MSWKEDRVVLLKKIISETKEELGYYLGELVTIEEEIERERRSAEEIKELRTIVKRFDEGKELLQEALVNAENITEEDLKKAYDEAAEKIIKESKVIKPNC